jgi:hypothetical protein
MIPPPAGDASPRRRVFALGASGETGRDSGVFIDSLSFRINVKERTAA